MAKLVKLYDENGERVGTYCIETGRAQIGDKFFAVERTCKNASIDNDDFVCSKCNSEMPFAFVYQNNIEVKIKFCPICGARIEH